MTMLAALRQRRRRRRQVTLSQDGVVLLVVGVLLVGTHLLPHVAATAAPPPPIPKACEPPHDHYDFCDISLSLEERLDDLIARLTIEEKPYLLTARESPKGNISRLGIPECRLLL